MARARVYVATYADPEAYAVAHSASGAGAARFVAAVGDTFRAKTVRVGLGQLGVGVGRASAPVSLTAHVPNEHVFMFATEARRVSGWNVGRRHIFHPRPNEQAFATSALAKPWQYAVITAPFQLMDALGPAVTGFDPGIPLNNDQLFLAPETELARLLSLMNDAARLAEEAPWIVAAPEPAKALAGAIADALLACLAEGQARQDRVALRRHRQIVARLEEALRDRPEEMLSVPDLCAALGVARRTLNLACMEFLGQGPMQYARGRRLEHVRAALLGSEPGETTITRVAMRFGFWELGRFAQAYRARFSERPSDTVRRNQA